MSTKKELTKLFIDTVKDQTRILCNKKNINFNENKDKIGKYFKENATEKYNSAIKLASSEAKEADFLDGIKRGKVHDLVGQVWKISFNHSCLKFSEEIVEFLLK